MPDEEDEGLLEMYLRALASGEVRSDSVFLHSSPSRKIKEGLAGWIHSQCTVWCAPIRLQYSTHCCDVMGVLELPAL